MRSLTIVRAGLGHLRTLLSSIAFSFAACVVVCRTDTTPFEDDVFVACTLY